MDIAGTIAALAAPAAGGAGLVVDGVDITESGGSTQVLVTVDLPDDAVGSADIDAVAAASRAISAALDAAGVPAGPHTLEVSTPGISRPLTEPRHFARARTRLVSLDLAGGETVTGRLTDMADGALTLEVDGTPRTLPLADVLVGRVEIDMGGR